MSKVFKALSDPTRREILKLLNKGDMKSGEIADCFYMSKPAITKHLDILKQAKLISSKKQGIYVSYSININVLQEALSNFLALFENKQTEHKK